jgi:hypothetical protein
MKCQPDVYHRKTEPILSFKTTTFYSEWLTDTALKSLTKNQLVIKNSMGLSL